MKTKYRLFKRGEYFYSENAVTRKQESLHTGDKTEAQRLIAAKNEAVNNPQLTLAVGRAYLAVTDPDMLTRTWFEVMAFLSHRGGDNTKERCARALRSASFDRIRQKAILETNAADFFVGIIGWQTIHESLSEIATQCRDGFGLACWPSNPCKKMLAESDAKTKTGNLMG